MTSETKSYIYKGIKIVFLRTRWSRKLLPLEFYWCLLEESVHLGAQI